MVLSEDEVLNGEVLWRAFKCSHPTFSSFTLYRHPFSPAVGRSPTLTIEALLRRYAAPSTFAKVLARTTVIYIVVTPWFVKKLPSMYPVLHPNSLLTTGPSYPHLTFISALNFRFHYAFCLWGTRIYFRCLLLPRGKISAGYCVPQWRISCNPAVLHREIMACSLTLAQGYFTVVIFS